MSRQKWGQHFLNDEAIAKAICNAFQPPGSFGEIGPGTGALTRLLCQRFEDFFVFEIDPQLASQHRRNPKLHVIEGDFLRWNFQLSPLKTPEFSLIGNLPYESGSEMLKRIALNADKVPHFVFMLQKEVCERLTAQPHTRDFSSFTVFMRGQYDIHSVMNVGRKSFLPPPKVDSQVIVGWRRSQRHQLSDSYLRFLRIAFAQKRKTLRNNLKPFKVDYALLKGHFGLTETSRAEEIAVDQWPQLFEKACPPGERG